MVYKQTVIGCSERNDKTIEHNTAKKATQQKIKKAKGQSYLSTPTLETYDLRTERLGNEFVSWAKNIRKDNREKRFKVFYGMEDFEVDHDLIGEDIYRLKKNAFFKSCILETKKWLGLHTFAGLIEGSMKETYAKAILTEYSPSYSELIKKQEAYEDQRKKEQNMDNIRQIADLIMMQPKDVDGDKGTDNTSNTNPA
jgi:hypothetical protein